MEEEEEDFGEFRESVKASAKGEGWSIEEGPKMRRSLNSEGVMGITTSSFSGNGQRCGVNDNGDGFFLGLKY